MDSLSSISTYPCSPPPKGVALSNLKDNTPTRAIYTMIRFLYIIMR